MGFRSKFGSLIVEVSSRNAYRQVTCSVQSIGDVKHLDLTIAANQTDGGFLRFDMVSADLVGVNVTSIAGNPMSKKVEGAAYVGCQSFKSDEMCELRV